MVEERNIDHEIVDILEEAYYLRSDNNCKEVRPGCSRIKNVEINLSEEEMKS